MLWQFAIAALATVALLGSSLGVGTEARAQTVQAATGSQYIGQSGSSPQVSTYGGVPYGTAVTTQGQTIQGAPGGQNAGQAGDTPQFPARAGMPPGTRASPQRLPGQNCRGLGSCAWGSQSEYTAACTADARVCTSTGGGPDGPSMRCSATGALRTCGNDNGSSTSPNIVPGTTGVGGAGAGITTSTGLGPNGPLGTGANGTGGTSTLPGLCTNC
jgi:hypothetical protein